MLKNNYKALLLCFPMIGVSGFPALAQSSDANAEENFYSREKYVAVTERAQEEYDPARMQWGSFLAQPELIAGVTSDSNLFASDDNEQSDIIVYLGAGVEARSTWSQNELGFDISGRQNEYTDFGSESNFDFRSRFFGRLDVVRDLNLRGEVFYDDRTEARTQIANSIANIEPIQFTRTGAAASANYQNDRTRATASVRVEDRNFDDGIDASGAEFDQDFRDRTTTTGTLLASYAVTPNVAVFAQATTSERDYDLSSTTSTSVINRDSTGYNLQGGVDFELTALLRGRIGAGYLENDRDDPGLADVDGVSIDGQLEWFPSQILTLTFDAARRIEDPGLLEAPNAIATRFGVRADYELRRNIILSASGRFGELDFDDIDRTDDFSELSISATYKLNRNIHLDAFIENIERDTNGTSNIVGQPFEKNVFGVGLSFYPF